MTSARHIVSTDNSGKSINQEYDDTEDPPECCGTSCTDSFGEIHFIAQDDYLSGRRGQYAERYGALAPWRGRWDIKFLQDLNINVGNGKTNTIQFSVDILNFGNLLSSKWGLIQQPNSVQPIGVSFDAAGAPVYTFDGTQTSTFGYSSNLDSRWQAQVGLRYIF